ncbi:chorismate synthase [Bacillus sp. SL00103]
MVVRSMMKSSGMKKRAIMRKQIALGGLEGGMSTGMPIVVRGVMKPTTLYKPLQSVDIETKEPFSASIERSDSCAVPAASKLSQKQSCLGNRQCCGGAVWP